MSRASQLASTPADLEGGRGWARRRGGLALRWALGLLALAALCWHLDPVRRLDGLTGMLQAGPALAGVGATLLLVAVRAWRWNVILGACGEPLPAGELARVYGASFFLGLISPGKIGELQRIWVVRARTGGLGAAAFTVAFDRIFDIAPTLMLVALFAFASLGWAGSAPVGALFCIASALAVALLLRPAWLWRQVERLASALLRRMSRGGAASDAARPAPVSLGAGLVGRALALSLLSQGLAVLQVYCFARALGIDLDPLLTYAVVTVATVVASLPISVAGFGTREAAVVLALGSLGVGADQALGFSLLWLGNFLVMLAISCIAFLWHPPGTPERP